MFDLKDNLFMFINKNKSDIINILNKNHINYDFFPDEQIIKGYNIIELYDYSIFIWFDCDNISYAIDIKNIDDIFFTFDSHSLHNSNFLNYLQDNSIKFEKKLFHDGKYKVKDYYAYIFEFKDEKLNDLFVILNTKLNNEILEITINYDGYTPFYYKKGISLKKYLNNRSLYIKNN